MTIVVILGILVYLATIQSTKSDSIPLSIIKYTLAQLSNSTLQPSQEQISSNSSLLNVINQTQDEPQEVNATSSDSAVSNQTNGTSDNQTMQATNGTNGTSANGTTVEIPSTALQQQPQTPLQSPPSLQQQPLPPSLQQQPLPPSLQQQPLPPSLQQQPLPPPIPQQPFTLMPPTIPVSIVPNAATRGNQAFQPNPIYVNILTGITWINYDTQIHTVTGTARSGQVFDSNILSPGATFTLNFVQYGTFPYHCTLHPQMVGTVA